MGFITDFMAMILNFIYSWANSYAVAIILFTLLIKLILLPLDIKSRKSMRKTTLLQPQIDAINKKYANDQQKKSQKISELYKAEKVSPLSGCLPVLLQFPILIAMFTMLRHLADEQTVQMFLTVQETGAFTPTSFFWVHNIWQPDNFLAPIIPDLSSLSALAPIANNPIVTETNVEMIKNSYETVMQPVMQQYSAFANGWGILPILSAGTQFLATRMQNKQQPAAAAGQQQGMTKMMSTMMPLISLFFCWMYNSAFALYWTTTNVYSLVQSFLLNRYFEKKEAGSALVEKEGK